MKNLQNIKKTKLLDFMIDKIILKKYCMNKKDFDTIMSAMNTDVLGLQETKGQDDQVREALFGLPSSSNLQTSNGILHIALLSLDSFSLHIC